MSPADAKEFFKFVTRTLPDLLNALDPEAALEQLAVEWRAHRDAKIQDRSEEVKEGRAVTDARLAQRRSGRHK